MQELINLEQRLQPHLLKKYYTVIGPSNSDDFGKFVKMANRTIDGVTIHQVLNSKPAIHNVLKNSGYVGEIRIYVMLAVDVNIYFHSTVEKYLSDNNIDFQI